MIYIRSLLLTLFLLSVLILSGCGDGGESGILKIRITDSPYPFELISEAKVTIYQVSVHVSDNPNETSGFFVLPLVPPLTFDLLKLQGGVTETLVYSEFPAGTYNQIRLYVSGGFVKLTDGRVFNLDVPSGAQSGIKIFPKPPIAVSGGLTTDLLLDFDVSRSFLPIPSAPTKVEDIESFTFNPVVRVVNSSEVGSISGKVYDIQGTPDNTTDDTPLEDATLSAFEGTVEVASTASGSDGSYVLLGLPEGSYDIKASRTGYQEATRSGVSVVVGNDTGGIDFRLSPQP